MEANVDVLGIQNDHFVVVKGREGDRVSCARSPLMTANDRKVRRGDRAKIERLTFLAEHISITTSDQDCVHNCSRVIVRWRWKQSE